MVVGDRNYRLTLSRLAFNFKGAISMEYLENASTARIRELTEHAEVIAKDIADG